jgi:hypothetical protein
MSLSTELEDIKRANALTECFNKDYFNVCPINEVHGVFGYPHRKLLHRAHCMEFRQLSRESIVELKKLAYEAVYYKRPWWRTF